VAFLPKQVTNSYVDVAAIYGMRAASELGGQFEQVGPAVATGAAQVPFIQTLTTQKVDVIVVSAADPDAIAPALDAARQAGINVVGYDSSPALGAYDVVRQSGRDRGCRSDVGPDGVRRSARLQWRHRGALRDLDGYQSERLDRRDEGALTDPRYAGLNLVDVVYGNDDDQTSQQARALLQSHPDLRVIVSPTTIGIVAAAKVLADTGNPGSVRLTGLGTPNSMRAYVEDGTVNQFALWNVEQLGYLAYYVAAKLQTGEIQGNPGETFSVPILGDYTIEDDGVVVLGSPLVFNAANIDQFSF